MESLNVLQPRQLQPAQRSPRVGQKGMWSRSGVGMHGAQATMEEQVPHCSTAYWPWRYEESARGVILGANPRVHKTTTIQ